MAVTYLRPSDGQMGSCYRRALFFTALMLVGLLHGCEEGDAPAVISVGPDEGWIDPIPDASYDVTGDGDGSLDAAGHGDATASSPSIDWNAPCESQPLATPPQVDMAQVNGSDFLYAAPDAPWGLLTIHHGGGGSMNNILERPEMILLANDALDAGLAIAALDSAAHLTAPPGEKPKWNDDDSADNPDLINTQAMVARLSDPDDLGQVPPAAPIFVFGVSNGGTFVSRLVQHMDVSAVVVFISHAQIFHRDDVLTPPLFLMAAEQDGVVGSESMTALSEKVAAMDDGVVAFHLNTPDALTPGRFTRISGVDCALSKDIGKALDDGGYLDETGRLYTSPAESDWKSVMPDGAAPHVFGIGDELMELYADHMVSNEFDDALFEFLYAQLQ